MKHRFPVCILFRHAGDDSENFNLMTSGGYAKAFNSLAKGDIYCESFYEISCALDTDKDVMVAVPADVMRDFLTKADITDVKVMDEDFKEARSKYSYSAV